MTNIVISQSMYFPWVGLLEQVRLADLFVHFDDVQFDRGFYNRVQVKTEHGLRWITVPLSKHRRDQTIDEIAVDNSKDWRKRHRDVLFQAYRKAPYFDDVLAVIDAVFEGPMTTLAEVSRASLLALIDYFGLRAQCSFHDVRELGVAGSRSSRLRDIVLALGGTTYITGHGAKNYLDHELFECVGIAVRYMDYQHTPYPQLHGGFMPYVTGLDLIANCGRDGVAIIKSPSMDWRQFENATT